MKKLNKMNKMCSFFKKGGGQAGMKKVWDGIYNKCAIFALINIVTHTHTLYD